MNDFISNTAYNGISAWAPYISPVVALASLTFLWRFLRVVWFWSGLGGLTDHCGKADHCGKKEEADVLGDRKSLVSVVQELHERIVAIEQRLAAQEQREAMSIASSGANTVMATSAPPPPPPPPVLAPPPPLLKVTPREVKPIPIDNRAAIIQELSQVQRRALDLVMTPRSKYRIMKEAEKLEGRRPRPSLLSGEVDIKKFAISQAADAAEKPSFETLKDKFNQAY